MLTLRHIVMEEKGLYRAAPDEQLILRYYANSIIHHFDPSAVESN